MSIWSGCPLLRFCATLLAEAIVHGTGSCGNIGLLWTTNTCTYIFHDRARAMLASEARQWMPPCTTKGIYSLVFLVLNSCPAPGESQWCNPWLPGWWQCKKRTYPKPWLISCSAPVRIGSMLLKAVSLQRAPCHKPKWAQVAFGLVLCLSSTSIALAGSWSSHQKGAAPVSPPGVVQIHLQGTPARSGSTRVPRPQGVL